MSLLSILSHYRRLSTIPCIALITALSPAATYAGDFEPVLPDRGGIVAGYSATQAAEAMKERGMHRIEGIWQVTDGATVVIELANDGAVAHGANDVYRIVVTKSPDRSVRPGTILGYAAPTATADKYEARLFTSTRSKGKARNGARAIWPAIHYTLTLTDADSRLLFTPRKSGLKFDIRHSVPLLMKTLRTTLRYRPAEDRQPATGCVRLYPAPAIPAQPIYL